MNREEWNQWHDDLRLRFPETATYLAHMPMEARNTWFNEIFSRFELRDALAVNRVLFETGEGLGKYERDKLAPLFIRLLQEQAYARRTREEEHRQEHIGSLNCLKADPLMGPAYGHVCALIRQHKQANSGQMPEQSLISQWTSDYMDEHDDIPDDHENMPRYRCLRCADSGLVSFTDERGRPFVGACNCDAGRKRKAKPFKHHGPLGDAPHDHSPA